VYTWTTDRRFPACLGREATADAPAHMPSLIPYLSETRIVKIASGGYMTAALSSDGEFFLWGQACPGTEGELALPKHPDDERPEREASTVDDDQDEIVKCVEIKMPGGDEARVVDVAVGHGHILVAVEVGEDTAVFAAGEGESGQLGLGEAIKFQSDFTEIPGLRGLKVKNMAAAGWSSWVVMED
ncbi:RCC1/BLIP-II, partial [Lophiostoma macrostomum CBS 122681]